MNIEEMYQELNKIVLETATAYNSDLLIEFDIYIKECYGENMPIWAKAFHQIYIWQFEEMYEGDLGLIGYYGNSEGNTSYKTIIAVSEYLKQNGYIKLYEYYIAPLVKYDEEVQRDFCTIVNEYPEEMEAVLEKTVDWVDNKEGIETVWNFYVDILKKHKSTLLTLQKENKE